MNALIAHRGGEIVSRDALDLVPMPKATDTYVPIPHYELASTMVNIGHDILTDYILEAETYAIAKQGNQMFAVLKFQRKEGSDMALSIAFRNSYDKSMSVGFACGASVFCCDNLALHGDIVVMRKHTKNVWNTLEDTIIATLYKSQKTFDQIVADSQTLQALALSDTEAFRTLGLLFGRDILSPRQLPIVKEQWLKPQHQEFQPRNMWSFYNSCTQALKSTSPLKVMERHIQLHNTLANPQ